MRVRLLVVGGEGRKDGSGGKSADVDGGTESSGVFKRASLGSLSDTASRTLYWVLLCMV